MHDEFREILIMFDLRIRVKFPILISLKSWQEQESLVKCFSILMEDIFSKVGVELQHNKKNLFGFDLPYFYEVITRVKVQPTSGTKK